MAECGWVFYESLPEVDLNASNKPATNDGSKKPLHNILSPIRPARASRASDRVDSRSVGLQYRSLNEIQRQRDQLSMSTLCLPKRWRVSDSIHEF
jgi:hypothetical protein